MSKDNSFTLKVGPKEFKITPESIFMDDGKQIKLITENEPMSMRYIVITSMATMRIKRYERIHHEHTYGANTDVFSLNIGAKAA